MKKQHLYLLFITFALLILMIVFFKPLPFKNIVHENDRLIITANELGIRDGAPYIDYMDDQNITPDEKRAIMTVIGEYSYRRTFGTLISGDNHDIPGDRILFIYAYNENASVDMIMVSSSGTIIINDNKYHMDRADQFITRIGEIISMD